MQVVIGQPYQRGLTNGLPFDPLLNLAVLAHDRLSVDDNHVFVSVANECSAVDAGACNIDHARVGGEDVDDRDHSVSGEALVLVHRYNLALGSDMCKPKQGILSNRLVTHSAITV